MVYTGLNENEIAKITKILDDHKVQYQVSSNEQVLERISQMSEEELNLFRKQAKRSGHALMQIEIELAEFKKLPQTMKERLYALGIYEEIESPFTEEDFQAIEKEPAKVKKPDPYAGIKQVAGLIAVAIFLFLMFSQR